MKKKSIRGFGADSVLLDIYEELRTMHSSLKGMLRHRRYKELPEEMKNALEGAHSVLYMAEYTAIKEDNNAR